MVATSEADVAVEEARLARAATAGDGSAFAVLYERYEQAAFNLAYRIAGSEAAASDAVQKAFLNAAQGPPRLADGDPSFAPCLFGATRDACHDMMPRRQRLQPGEMTLPPTLEPEQEAIAGASMRLPMRQREALALRQLGQLSHEEIASIMEASQSAVAQLVSRARINLSDELHGTVLASIAAPSPECERALPLIAMREDGQLEAASREEAWLDLHLADCDRCRLGVEAMQEAAASYRAWAPLAAAPELLEQTMAKAAALSGADWSAEIAVAAAARRAAHASTAEPLARAPSPDRGRSRRQRPILAVGLAALMLLAGLAAILVLDDPATAPLDPAADAAPAPGVAAQPAAGEGKGPAMAGRATKQAAEQRKRQTKTATSAAEAPDGEAASAPGPTPTQVASEGGTPDEPSSGPSRPPGKAAVEPTQRTSAPKPKPRPVTTTTTPAAAPVPAPVTEEPAPVEESPSRRREPPGRPGDWPPRLPRLP